jgi:hypothetical protein
VGAGIRKQALQQERSPSATRIKAYAALYRNPSDPPGVHRHELGGINEGLFDNALVTPAPGLVNTKWQIYQFSTYPEIITDQVDAANYMWLEGSNGSGTPLALDPTVLGGAAKIVTGASNGNYYYYQAYQKLAMCQQGKDFWFEITLVPTGMDTSDFFAGVCATLASGNLFANRVNSIGFFNYYAGLAVGFEVRVGGVATQAQVSVGNSAIYFSDGTEIALGFRYYSGGQQVAYYVNHQYAGRIRADGPAVMTPTSFGMKTNASAARTLVVKHIVLGVEI